MPFLFAWVRFLGFVSLQWVLDLLSLVSRAGIEVRSAFMPLFEYRCEKCGEVSEFLEKSSGGSKHKCSHCGSGKLGKIISTFSPQIKAGESKRCHGCNDHTCPHSGN